MNVEWMRHCESERQLLCVEWMRQCESEHQPLYVDQEWDKTGGIVSFDLDCPRQGEAKTLHYE